MPQIPNPTTPSVAPTLGSAAYLNVTPTPAAFGAQVGDAQQRVGAALGQASDTASQAANAFQGLQNETDAKNADIALAKQLTDATFNPQSGYFGKLGKDAVDGYQSFQDSVHQAYQDVRSSLPNPATQRMFDAAAVKRVEYALQTGASHAAQQNKIWQVGTSEARATLEMNTAANYYNDDTRFGQAISTIKDEALSQGELQGWSPEQVAAKQAAYVGQAWTQRIQRTAYDDPVKALDMYDQNQTQIGAAQRPQLESFLKNQVQPVLARNIVQSVMAGAPTVNPQTLPALHAAVQNAESGGDPNAIGPYVPGKGTAKGSMQVMDATNWSPGFGVRPAADNSAAERARVGNDYLDAMVARYGGDQSLALAAYNWGPGKVDQALSKYGDPRTGATTEAQFLTHLPTATQTYIAGINAKVAPAAGNPPTSTDIRSNLANWQSRVSQLATNLYPNDPTFRDAAVGNLNMEVNRVATAQDATEKSARDSLISLAIGSNGSKPTTLDQLLATPDAKNAWSSITPSQQIGIIDLVDHNAKGMDPPMTDAAMATYYRLKGEAANNPAAFAQEDLSKQFGSMPHHLTLDLINLQASADGRQARDAQQAQNLTHAMTISKPMLMAAGVHIPTSTDGPAKAQDYDAFTGRLSEELSNFWSQNKRQPTDKEVRGIANGLLVQGTDTSRLTGIPFFRTPASARAFQVQDPSQFSVPIPDAERPKVVSGFQKAFGRAPTDQELGQFYTQYALANAKGK